MIKLILKRKKSGKVIKQLKREAELRPTKVVELEDGTKYIQKVYKRHENQGLYNKNKPDKRHRENPNIYKGEDPLHCSIRNIRVPKKCRKTAMKRFKKAFPNIKVNKKNQPYYEPVQVQNNSTN